MQFMLSKYYKFFNTIWLVEDLLFEQTFLGCIILHFEENNKWFLL